MRENNFLIFVALVAVDFFNFLFSVSGKANVPALRHLGRPISVAACKFSRDGAPVTIAAVVLVSSRGDPASIKEIRVFYLEEGKIVTTRRAPEKVSFRQRHLCDQP